MGLTKAGFPAAVYAAWVPVEEEHLARTYGPPYTGYLTSTARW